MLSTVVKRIGKKQSASLMFFLCRSRCRISKQKSGGRESRTSSEKTVEKIRQISTEIRGQRRLRTGAGGKRALWTSRGPKSTGKNLQNSPHLSHLRAISPVSAEILQDLTERLVTQIMSRRPRWQCYNWLSSPTLHRLNERLLTGETLFTQST